MAAVISKIYPGGQFDVIEDVHEGDVILEWNGVGLSGKTHEEVQRIVNDTPTDAELELVLRCPPPSVLLPLLRLDDDDDSPLCESNHLQQKDRRDHQHQQQGTQQPRVGFVNCSAGDRREAGGRGHLSFTGQQRGESLLAVGPHQQRAASNFVQRQFVACDSGVKGSERLFLRNSKEGIIDNKRGVGIGNGCLRNGALLRDHRSNDGMPPPPSHQFSEQVSTPSSSNSLGSSSSATAAASFSASPADGASINDPMKALLFQKDNNDGYCVDDSQQRSTTDLPSSLSSSQRSHGTPSTKSSCSNHSPKRRYRRVPCLKVVWKTKEEFYGKLQLQICYDVKAEILYVIVLRAKGLTCPRADGDTRPDPFVKCRLLPDKTSDTTRKTKFIRRTGSPEWKQTMVYPKLPILVMRMRRLECVVWHHNKVRANEYLGEILLDLSDSRILDEQPRWYRLRNGTLPIPSNKIIFGSDKKRILINHHTNPFHVLDKRLFGSNVSLTQRLNQQTGIVGMSTLSQQSKHGARVSIFPASNIAAHPLLSKYGCHGTASMCVLM
ncbi:unnamed protein product [Notodromas monacha]|uniref:Uncharacterized protein n=1 Tax=Notodromas monacha TaxID=399045 RepID=A0A7R9BM03_9CRUS|nr:unnamed protein product [Notodromas monacha]CAG0917953.1 unnamed protein product [Notodromas monacha]